MCVDLKCLVDAKDNMHVAWSAVCAGVMYHVACLALNKVPKHVMQVFMDKWLTHHGVQEIVEIDIRITGVMLSGNNDCWFGTVACCVIWHWPLVCKPRTQH